MLLKAKDLKLQSVIDVFNMEGTVGEISDGYHTFDELYYHRMILFACMCNICGDAYKSKLHHDGTMYDDYFIVWIDTPKGTASYHYHMDHWDRFSCSEKERAPEFDGHTSDDVLERLYDFFNLAYMEIN